MAGMLPSKNPVSLMIAASAASRSLLAVEPRVEALRRALLLALEHVPDVDREAHRGWPGSRRPPWRGRGSGPCRPPSRERASGRRRSPARTAARSTGRADRPAGRRSGRRPGPSGRPRHGASRRRRRDGRRLRDLDVLEAGGPQGRRPATRRLGERRARAPAGPRCSGSGGSPCSFRAGRRGSRPGAARSRSAWRFGQASPKSIEGAAAGAPVPPRAERVPRSRGRSCRRAPVPPSGGRGQRRRPRPTPLVPLRGTNATGRRSAGVLFRVAASGDEPEPRAARPAAVRFQLPTRAAHGIAPQGPRQPRREVPPYATHSVR